MSHAPVRSHNKIFLAGRTGKMIWEDGSYEDLLIIFANDYYLRVKTANGKEFVTVREAMHRFYPEEPV